MRALLILLLILTALPARATEPAPFILVDQFGYVPSLEKRAVIRDPQIGFDAARSFQPGETYAVIDLRTGEAVHRGHPVAWQGGQVDDVSGDRVWWFDFSSVTRPGLYVVRDLDRGVDSDPFEISPTVYRPVLREAFRVFYYQRAGFEKRAPFARRAYADDASHMGRGQDGAARRFDAEDDPDTERDLRGGWFDAGDYNQYTGWTANYVSGLLAAYAENPAVWTDDMGIPESGNGVPDVLDEVRWGLAWLARMQNADGSMLSVLGRDSASPPSKARGPSFYGPANTSATVTAAGAFAVAAETFGRVPELAGLSDDYAARALRAWRWSQANPDVRFENNSAVFGSEGLAAGQQEVGRDRLDRKRLIAAAQLFGLTGEPAFAEEVGRLYRRTGGIAPDTANGFEGDLAFTLLNFANRPGVPPALSQRIRRDYAASLSAWNGFGAVDAQGDAYGAYVDGYWWGSNAVKARRGSVFTQAVVGGIDPKTHGRTVNSASHYLHYLHGVNPMGLVYLSNMDEVGAERSVSTLYHAWFPDGSRDYDSTKTSRHGPAPGFLVGGPNDSYSRDACCETHCGGHGDRVCRRPGIVPPTGQPPAKSYGEFNDDWPLNSWEVTEPSLAYQTDYLRLLSKFVR
ncbi:glycoside hydrolase family 9 protein [uncultured Algimonas sp.]|uniref:glycoside hydrolase family 9 protein n=1 Tax=uncultured Algimonas sp. TaxID=1547920 RepID=UPI0026371CF8|nr:glycoside hydrolase family 9 protein [uncultured Algimonas sp.]